MICQICSKHPATVHITELRPGKSTGKKARRRRPGKSGADEAAPPEAGSALNPKEPRPKEVAQRHICEACATSLDLPHSPVVAKKEEADIWKLLQQSARRARQEANLTCPDCGMTLAEFRSKGRLGCPKDYEIFRKHLEPVLLRVHNATRHEGRVPAENAPPAVNPAAEADAPAPGTDSAAQAAQATQAAQEGVDRLRQLTRLREKLEAAIRDEAYESAARLRDEIQELEAHLQGPA